MPDAATDTGSIDAVELAKVVSVAAGLVSHSTGRGSWSAKDGAGVGLASWSNRGVMRREFFF
jgi:hypothetical protein